MNRFVAKSLGFLWWKISSLKVLMRTLLVTKIISSLIVVNSDELEFLTKALILIWPSALFFFLFHFFLSLTLSIRNSQTIPTPNQITFATSKRRYPLPLICTRTIPFATISPSWQSHSWRSRRSPFATISPNCSLSPPNRSPYLSLLLAHRHFCLLSSLKLAIITEAWSLSPIKPQWHFGSLPHRRFSSLSSIQLPQPFDFHPHRLFAFPLPLQTPATLRLPLQSVTLRLPFKLFFFS